MQVASLARAGVRDSSTQLIPRAGEPFAVRPSKARIRDRAAAEGRSPILARRRDASVAADNVSQHMGSPNQCAAKNPVVAWLPVWLSVNCP